jgi:hypothetical protein
MKKFLLVLLVIGIQQVRTQSIEVGLFGGGAYYVGDLNPKSHFLNTDIAYGGLIRYVQDKRWAYRGQFTYGKIKGDDASSGFMPERQLSFTSKIYELSFVSEFNFLPYFTGSAKDVFSPYLFAGLSGFYHRPTLNDISLRDLNTEGEGGDVLGEDTHKVYSLYQIAIPFGFGFKYSFSGKFAVALEWGLRRTFTDYLDDVSTQYYLSSSTITPGDHNYDNIQISDPSLNHEPYMQRGLRASQDWYSFAGLSVFYRFNLSKRGKCSTFNN